MKYCEKMFLYGSQMFETFLILPSPNSEYRKKNGVTGIKFRKGFNFVPQIFLN